MQWVINHFVDLVILILAGILATFFTTWLKKEDNRRKFFAFQGDMLAKILGWLKRPVIVVLLGIVLVTIIVYVSGLSKKLFPKNRFKVALCIFLPYEKNDNEKRSWTITKEEIQKGLDTLKDEIDLEILNTVVTCEGEARVIGKAKECDLVIWGAICYLGYELEMEPHVTLLHSVDSLKPMISEPKREKIFISSFISEPSTIDFVRRKAYEVNNIILFVLGQAKCGSGDCEEAIKKYDEATKLKPDNTEAYMFWAFTLVESGRYEEAIEKCKKAIELKPDLAGAWLNWSMALGNLGRYNEAIEKLKKAIELKADYAEAYSNWGLALVSLGSYDAAIEKFEKAKELKPDLTEAYYNWGLALIDLNRYEEAIEKYKKAVELKPADEEAYCNWGWCLEKIGKHKAAIEKCKKAIELKPDYAEPWYMMACVYSLQNNEVEALKNLRRAIELDSAYKERAKKDEDFKHLWENEDFKKLVE